MKLVKFLPYITVTFILFFLVAQPASCLAQSPPPTDEVLAIPTVSNNNGVAVWSSGNYVYIDLSKLNDAVASVDIYDLVGRKIFTETLAVGSLYQKQVSQLPAGYVLVRIAYNGTYITRKLLIVNNG